MIIEDVVFKILFFYTIIHHQVAVPARSVSLTPLAARGRPGQLPGGITLSSVAQQQSDPAPSPPAVSGPSSDSRRSLPPSVQVSSESSSLQEENVGAEQSSGTAPHAQESSSRNVNHAAPVSNLPSPSPNTANVRISKEEVVRKDSTADTKMSIESIKMPDTNLSGARRSPAKTPNVIRPESRVSVDTLHNLKNFLEESKEPQERVIRGVGHQAFREFCNLVSTLQDRSLVIEDVNIRTLYFTILNFSRFPVNPDMRKYEPLSNFALKLQSFIDLRNLFRKDENIKKIVAEKLESDELDKFEVHVDGLIDSERDFIQNNQEENIITYHRIRNCLIDVTMTRLRVVHTKILSLDSGSAPDIFNDSVKMLKSLMNTHYNGQVLMMEKIRFNFDFLSTILDYLKVVSQTQEEVSIKTVNNLQRLDPMRVMIDSLIKDVSDVVTFHNIETILSQKLCRSYINSIKSVTDTENMSLVQKRGLYSLKNAIFLYKNNIKIGDLPLTNIGLEVAKIISLARFINKDAGIKAAISSRHGAVATNELEALVIANTGRGDEFVMKFAEKNIQLYHSLRNTALEKILMQITLVHSKVKNIEIPQSAKNSAEYHAAIKRLEDIVTADIVTRMLIIEEQKFDFDFLSTILLVWRTETARQEEAAKAAARPPAPAPAPAPVVPTTVVVKRPGPAVAAAASKRLRSEEEAADDPSPLQGRAGAEVINLDDDQEAAAVPRPPTAVTSRRSWPCSSKSASMVAAPRQVRPVATVTPMPPTSAASKLKTPVKGPQVPGKEAGRGQVAARPVTKVATQSNPMQVLDGAGELPIRTKCTLCSDRTSENMMQLVHHYSTAHFREDIGKYIKSQSCPSCSEKFEDKNELIKHVGLVHGTVHLLLTKTERWICDFCVSFNYLNGIFHGVLLTFILCLEKRIPDRGFPEEAFN